MALHDYDFRIPVTDPKTGIASRAFQEWVFINTRDKANRVEDGTEDNIVTLDSDGNPQDGLSSLPTGSIVGTTGTQTLTNKTLTSPAVDGLTGTLASPTITTPTITVPVIEDLSSMTHDHKSAAKGGDYPFADMVLAATQADASAISAVTLTAGSDSVNITTCNSTLATMRTEINAIVTAFNALIDKLQTAKLMT